MEKCGNVPTFLQKGNFYWVGSLENAHCPSYKFSGVSGYKLKSTFKDVVDYAEDDFPFNFF